MNVIISNEQQAVLSNLNIEIIKTVNGVYTADDIIDMFSNFFFGRMVFDVTALDGYKDPRSFQKLSISLAVEKIILLLPNIPECNSPNYISKLISMGFYNFTSNIDGVNYLLGNPNSYRDVAHLHQLESNVVVQGGGTTGGTTFSSSSSSIIAIKNLTNHAGATTLTYLLKKELSKMGLLVTAIEVNKRDFSFFNDKELISTTSENFTNELIKYRGSQVVLIDANDYNNLDLCSDVIYLFEPSIIMLNRLMMKDKKVFERLKGNKIVLNKCQLSATDVAELEYEARIKFFYTIPSVDDRKDNSDVLRGLLEKLGLVYYG